MWLHGFIFFGSAHSLLMQIKETVRGGEGGCRSLILDFRQVLGNRLFRGDDASQAAPLRGAGWIRSRLLGLAAPRRAFAVKGGLRKEAEFCHVFPNLDAALEWCEDRLLANSADLDEGRRSTEEWLKAELGGPELLERLKAYFPRSICGRASLCSGRAILATACSFSRRGG